MKIFINSNSTAEVQDDMPGKVRWHQHRFKRRDILQAHFRPAFYRYFQAWYRLNRHLFALPLNLCQQRYCGIRLSVGHIPPEIMHFNLLYKDAGFLDGSLDFYWNGMDVDHTVWMDAQPKKTAAGVICTSCHSYGEDLRVFPNKEALWEDHLFKVILRTVNEQIYPAERIELRYDNGFSYAKYVQPGDLIKSTEDTPVVGVIRPRGQPVIS